MDKKKLLEMAEKFQEKADRAYQNYQETGLARYDNERARSEDLAEALRAAASAADDHNHLVNLRGTLSQLAFEAGQIEWKPDDQKSAALEHLRKQLLALARLEGLTYS